MCNLSSHSLPQLLSCCSIYEGSRPKEMRIRKVLGDFLGINVFLSAMVFRFLISSFAIWLKGVNTSQQLALKWEGLVSVPGSHSVHCRNTVTLSDAQGACQSCSLSGLVLLLPAEAPLPCPHCCCFPLLCAVAFPCVQHSPSLSPPSTFPGLMLTPALPGSLDC